MLCHYEYFINTTSLKLAVQQVTGFRDTFSFMFELEPRIFLIQGVLGNDWLVGWLFVGKVLGVPPHWMEGAVSLDDSKQPQRRNLQAVHNLIVECCVDGCTPYQIVGLCN